MNDIKDSIHLPISGCVVPLEVSKDLETSAGLADTAQDQSLPEGELETATMPSGTSHSPYG